MDGDSVYDNFSFEGSEAVTESVILAGENITEISIKNGIIIKHVEQQAPVFIIPAATDNK